MQNKPCQFCGYEFDQEKLGKFGCPDCCGDGLETISRNSTNNLSTDVDNADN